MRDDFPKLKSPALKQLYKYVIEKPWLDTPRRQIANLLEAEGHVAWATFIRLELEEASDPTFPVCDRFHNNSGCSCVACELASLSQGIGCYSYGPPFSDRGDGPKPYGTTSRGFVGVVRSTTVELFLQYAKEIFWKHPVVEVDFSDAVQSLDRGDRPLRVHRERLGVLFPLAFPMARDDQWTAELPAKGYYPLMNDLSFAAVNYGRRLAGLIPLTRKQVPTIGPTPGLTISVGGGQAVV